MVGAATTRNRTAAFSYKRPQRGRWYRMVFLLVPYLTGCGISAVVQGPDEPAAPHTADSILTSTVDAVAGDEDRVEAEVEVEVEGEVEVEVEAEVEVEVEVEVEAEASRITMLHDPAPPAKITPDIVAPPTDRAASVVNPANSVRCGQRSPHRSTIRVPFEARVGSADIIFLIDRTASMQEEINLIGNQMQGLLTPAVLQAIPDARVGVATFADFPVDPLGDVERDDPFTLMTPAVSDFEQIQAAMDAIQLGDGLDAPESQVEALYQLATGDGLGTFIAPSTGCPSGSIGYPCFRRDALPVILLFTDAAFHNGPDEVNAYPADLISPPPHTYANAIRSMASMKVRVIGFDSGDGTAREHLVAVARDTGALDASGHPLVFSIGSSGESLGRRVVEAIQSFGESVIQDISLVVKSTGTDPGTDVTHLVERISALKAEPTRGVQSIDSDTHTFRGVSAGTVLTFEIALHDVVADLEPETGQTGLEVVFLADGRRVIGRHPLDLAAVRQDDSHCIE